MKRIVRSDVGLGMVLALPTFLVVSLTGASAGAIQLIAIGFVAIAIAWRHLDGTL